MILTTQIHAEKTINSCFMNTRFCLSGLLCVGLGLGVHGADRIELNEGWLFTPEEAIASSHGTKAAAFVIEKNDARPFRIHGSPDETKATYSLMEELAAEIRRVTGVRAEVLP